MKYSILLHTPNGVYPIFENIDIFTENGAKESIREGIRVKAAFSRKHDIIRVSLTASAERDAACYFSLYGSGVKDIYSFDAKCSEEHILRQSPHDYKNYVFKMDGTAVPMVAARAEQTDIFISDTPAHCDNYTTQHILPQTGEFYLSSGDPGGSPNFEGENFSPYYHAIGGEKTHEFRFIALRREADTVKSIRREVFLAIEAVWGCDSDSLYRAVCYATNYMHYRKNEAGTSDYWVVAGIQYANCQYQRDSFYQSMILPADMEAECYRAYSSAEFSRMENPLIFLIWSYRLAKRGGQIQKASADRAFKIMMDNMKKHDDGGYYPNCDEHGAFRNWFDICCFEFDDVDAYSQGLLVCALRAARELGYDIGDSYEKAKARYLALYNGSFIQMSAKKPYLALDYSIGDLMHHLLFGHGFIPDEMVQNTWHHIMGSAAKTPYGTKVVSAADGSYLPLEAFGAYGYVHPGMARLDLGRYANGGSYHVYEMLFHIAAHLHGVAEAVDAMIWRLFIDLDYDGATHEYMHTIKGNGVKAGQGWNAAVYAIWDELCKRGKGDPRFFAAAEEKMRAIR